MNFIFYIISPLFLLTSPKYENIYGEGYNDAVNFIVENREVIVEEFGNDSEKNAILLSVVFPELVRNTYMIDHFQERAMEIIYVNYGKDHANFSIGKLQMKPSFAEMIEKKYFEINKKELFKYRGKDDLAIREERIEKLKDFKYQLKYLEAFYNIMKNRFEDKRFKSFTERLMFYSSAYNYGFYAEEDAIWEWINQNAYPFGSDYEKNKYSYAEVSAYFYHKTWSELSPIFINSELR